VGGFIQELENGPEPKLEDVMNLTSTAVVMAMQAKRIQTANQEKQVCASNSLPFL